MPQLFNGDPRTGALGSRVSRLEDEGYGGEKVSYDSKVLRSSAMYRNIARIYLLLSIVYFSIFFVSIASCKL